MILFKLFLIMALFTAAIVLVGFAEYQKYSRSYSRGISESMETQQTHKEGNA